MNSNSNSNSLFKIYVSGTVFKHFTCVDLFNLHNQPKVGTIIVSFTKKLRHNKTK